MLAIFLLLQGCIALFQVWSPDALTSLVVNPVLASFGNSFLLPQIGKLYFLEYPGSCSFSINIPKNSFAILYNFDGCYYDDLALSVQNSGGIAMILVLVDDNTVFTMIAHDYRIGASISILSLGISNSNGATLMAYSTKEIWATYSYDFPPSQSASINFEMSSNYTLDSAYISELQILAATLSLPLSSFSLILCYVPDSTPGLLESDCVLGSGGYYCLPHTSTVTGSQMIYNTVNIINYFSIYIGTLTRFLSLLLNLYQTCADDYSTACLQGVFAGVSLNNSIVISTNGLFWETSPFYFINDTPFYWSSGVQLSYCLSLTPTPSSCPVCTSGCSYSDLSSAFCNSACNVAACGYENLTCLGSNGCYGFMMGDGNCNAKCVGDPDCGGSEVCETGCLYSDMQAGFCPVACSGTCFLNCNSNYCSPECTFSEMFDGLCPVECSSECFKFCTSSYCSPGCLTSEISETFCPDACESKCCAGNNEIIQAKLAGIILSVIFVCFM